MRDPECHHSNGLYMTHRAVSEDSPGMTTQPTQSARIGIRAFESRQYHRAIPVTARALTGGSATSDSQVRPTRQVRLAPPLLDGLSD